MNRILAVCTLAATAAVLPAAQHAAPSVWRPAAQTGHPVQHRSHLPVQRIERIVHAKGEVSSGVLDIGIDRPDIKARGPHGVPLKTGFVIQGDLTFQQRGQNRAALNADIPVKPREIQPVIDTIESHHLVFQAEHQHLYNIKPMVWFIHFRGLGRPEQLARRVHRVLAATATPLPQQPAKHPKTPLPAKRLAKILGGSPPTIGEHGIVTIDVPRKRGVKLGRVHVSPDLNIATNVQFEPLANGKTAVIPDFAMTARQIGPVTRLMRARHWEVGCLYNQETAEHPQLYFSHDFKIGNAKTLAHQIRRAIDHTSV
jgi:hypothetical protein